jgi:hypothetical protein
MDTNVTNHSPVDRTAFDYAWGYFALHSGQRLQSVNFFILAVAFLAATYVSAIVAGKPGLAAGLALLGATSSFLFYRIERRVRGLIHAAEAALLPMEDAMAANTSNANLQILKKVESVAGDAWSYSKVFRTLFASVGLTFTFGAFYAVITKIDLLSVRHFASNAGIRFAAAIVILSFGYAMFSQGMKAKRTDSRWIDYLGCAAALILGILMEVAGAAILIRIGARG